MKLCELAELNQKMKFHDFISYIMSTYNDGKNASAKLSILHDNDTLNINSFTSILREYLIPIKIRELEKRGHDVIVMFDEIKRD
jgi:hypothetical protein